MRHVLRHKSLSLLVDCGLVYQNFADVTAEVVAQCADNNVAFLVNQGWCGRLCRCIANGFPGLGLVIEIPLEFFCGSADTGGADNDAHAVSNFEFVHRRFEFAAIVTFYTSGYTTGTRIVWHQDQEASGQANKGG